MPYRHEVAVAAPAETVRQVATSTLTEPRVARAARAGAGHVTALLTTETRTRLQLDVQVEPAGPSTSRVVVEADPPPAIPYFQWFMGPLERRAVRRALGHTARSLAAAAEGRPAPDPPRRSLFAPAAPYDDRQAETLATIAAVVFVAGAGAALFSQNIDFIGDAFGASNQALGVAAAVTRVGVLFGLVATALADHRGRRRILLATLTGVCLSSALSAVAPNLELFTVTQIFSRGFFNAVFLVGMIAAVEEAPERSRAFSVALINLAFGAGGGFAIALLPLGDIDSWTWRLSFLVVAGMVVMVPSFARHLTETQRYSKLAARTADLGRVRELLDRRWRRRLLLVLLLALLANVFAAPSSQFTNRFLGDERGFSGLEITLFRAVTSGVPGLVGLFIGGRLAEAAGRKRLAGAGVVFASLFTVAFYLSDGALLWAFGTVEIFLAALVAPALAAFGPELFPTEVRGTANAALLVFGLTGSVVGLVAAGALAEPLGLGPAVSVLAVAPVLMAILVIPRLPEASHKDLDVVSPPIV